MKLRLEALHILCDREYTLQASKTSGRVRELVMQYLFTALPWQV